MPSNKLDNKILSNLYTKMLKSRMVSEKIIELYPEQEMRCPVHLSFGQEAIGAGVCENLTADDAVFSHHRNHSQYLSMGGNLNQMLAELYGKITGCCRGNGGSMHLSDPDSGFIGASSIIGGTIPVAVGAALSFQIKKEKRVAVAFFGDGAVAEGVFHESLNIAALKKLPIVFVCENNFYAVLSRLKDRHNNSIISDFAKPYDITGLSINGNDVLEVFHAAKESIERARKGNGPSLIVCETYRWREHVGPNCDHENGHRPACEVEEWQKLCPIKKIEDDPINEQIFLNKQNITKTINQEIDEAVRFAKESSLPTKDDLLRFVYPE